MKYAIALLAFLSLAGRAYAGEDCALPKPPLLGPLGQWARDASARMDPAVFEQQQRQKAARATYEALLAAGAPEKLACAAALNPQVFDAVAPTYFGRSR
jgi:hypothetical protein